MEAPRFLKYPLVVALEALKRHDLVSSLMGKESRGKNLAKGFYTQGVKAFSLASRPHQGQPKVVWTGAGLLLDMF